MLAPKKPFQHTEHELKEFGVQWKLPPCPAILSVASVAMTTVQSSLTGDQKNKQTNLQAQIMSIGQEGAGQSNAG